MSDTSYLDQIRNVPITDFAGRLGFHLVKKSNRYFSLKEHDSVIINVSKNAFWRNSTGASGGVIDFAMEFCNCATPKAAMDEIASIYGIERNKEYTPTYNLSYASAGETRSARAKGDVKFPERAESNKIAWAYLQNERCIDKSVLYYFLSHHMFYQDIHRNCVFHTSRFACVRSTGSKKFAIDAEGCDYEECFFFKGQAEADTLYVCESVINIMSLMTIMVREKQRYSSNAYLALSGATKTDSIFFHLDREPQITTVFLCFDNDNAGDLAFTKVSDRMKQDYPEIHVVRHNSPTGNDWNDHLKNISKS
jgi:hypothetical protein